jgi:ribonuclease HII
VKLKSYYKLIKYEAGCDEAGRGCLAGPVVAAAVILDPDNPILGLNDSKQLSDLQRRVLREEIVHKALAYAICESSPQEIDRINILRASLKAMANCVLKLNPKPEFILVDGNKTIPIAHIPQLAVVKGDSLYQAIAAASILAKTSRDDIMARLHEEFPVYGWDQNKAYPTKFHRSMILMHGPSPHHRKTFKVSSPDSSKNLFNP